MHFLAQKFAIIILIINVLVALALSHPVISTCATHAQCPCPHHRNYNIPRNRKRRVGFLFSIKNRREKTKERRPKKFGSENILFSPLLPSLLLVNNQKQGNRSTVSLVSSAQNRTRTMRKRTGKMRARTHRKHSFRSFIIKFRN